MDGLPCSRASPISWKRGAIARDGQFNCVSQLKRRLRLGENFCRTLPQFFEKFVELLPLSGVKRSQELVLHRADNGLEMPRGAPAGRRQRNHHPSAVDLVGFAQDKATLDQVVDDARDLVRLQGRVMLEVRRRLALELVENRKDAP